MFRILVTLVERQLIAVARQCEEHLPLKAGGREKLKFVLKSNKEGGLEKAKGNLIIEEEGSKKLAEANLILEEGLEKMEAKFIIEEPEKMEANLILEGFADDKREEVRKDFENLVFKCMDEAQEQFGPKSWDGRKTG